MQDMLSLLPISPMPPAPPANADKLKSLVLPNSHDASHHAMVDMANILMTLREGIAHAFIMLFCLMPIFQSLLLNTLRRLSALKRSPTLLLEDNVRLEDALGRVLSLPYEHFRYWPVLQARIQCEFRDRLGESMVMQNRYSIVNLVGGGNRVLTRKTWDRSVFPGAQLAMSMLFSERDMAQYTCPRCSSSVPRIGEQIWLQWSV